MAQEDKSIGTGSKHNNSSSSFDRIMPGLVKNNATDAIQTLLDWNGIPCCSPTNMFQLVTPLMGGSQLTIAIFEVNSFWWISMHFHRKPKVTGEGHGSHA